MSGIGLEKCPVFHLRRTGDKADRQRNELFIQPHPSLALSLSLWLPSTDIPLSDLKPTQTFGTVLSDKASLRYRTQACRRYVRTDLNCRLLPSVKNNGWHIVLLPSQCFNTHLRLHTHIHTKRYIWSVSYNSVSDPWPVFVAFCSETITKVSLI